MSFTVHVRVEYPTPEGIYSKRAITRAMKACHQAMGDKWVNDFLPLHFQPGNTARYGFVSRTDKYKYRKIQMAQRAEASKKKRSNRLRPVLFDGQVDLVLHGDLRDDVLVNHQVKAFPSRTRITLGSGRLPYLVEKPRRSRTANIANEIRTVIREELRELEQVGARAYFESLAGREGKYIYQTTG